jgi:hypothetical protein
MGLTPSERTEFAMAERTTLPRARARLGALGEYLRRHAFFAPLSHHVQIRHKAGKSRPLEKGLAALVGLRCGAKTIVQSHVTVRGDPAVHRACGRKGGAGHSTIARTFQAGTPQPGQHLEHVAGYDLERYGHPPATAFASASCGSRSSSPPCPRGPKPRAVNAPGGGGGGARRGGRADA